MVSVLHDIKIEIRINSVNRRKSNRTRQFIAECTKVVRQALISKAQATMSEMENHWSLLINPTPGTWMQGWARYSNFHFRQDASQQY